MASVAEKTGIKTMTAKSEHNVQTFAIMGHFIAESQEKYSTFQNNKLLSAAN